ncbi:glycosyltransferase family 92 domain-containing protein [Ditylenchus destructor]|nr:glycosyltransferase family 92 domain-containing protein [Ditylenchus destructor]
MNLITFFLRLTLRIYAKLMRAIIGRFKAKEPPSAYTTLAILSICALYNTANDNVTNHYVFLSTTYYESSPIYKPHTVVALFNAVDQIRLRRTFICYSKNETHSYWDYAKIRYAYDPVGVCKWTAYIATCRVFEGFKELTMAHSHMKRLEIPIRLPYKSKRKTEVAACFSPLFYNERWQLILTTLEIYRHFGVHLQVFYIQSILEDIMRVLKIYQTEGFAEIEPWPSIKLGAQAVQEIGFDPNLELDWRNQASSHTDCFLKYREAAEFIIFGDVDDVLLPKLGTTYMDEFRLLSSTHPTAAGFTYSRYNTQLQTGFSSLLFVVHKKEDI